MIEKKQCCYICSLRTGTLILLWIVMIGCAFHTWFVNFNQYHLESLVKAKSNTEGVGNFDKIIRQKRFIDLNKIDLMGTITNTSEQISQNLKDKVTKPLEKITNDAIKEVNELPKNIVKNLTKDVSNGVTNVIKNAGKGVIDVVTKELEDSLNKEVNKFEDSIQPILKTSVRYFIRIWSILGICCSALGIFGIHTNFLKCLAFSVFFFYFSILFCFLIMVEINVDSSTERKMFLMSELAGIDWRAVIGNSMILPNLCISCFIALSLCSTIVVKIFRKTVSKENVVDGKSSEDEVMTMKSIAP